MIGCLICGGVPPYLTAFGKPCPNCSKEVVEALPNIPEIPVQYQNVRFDRTFLPENLQDTYGVYMEELIDKIVKQVGFYKNILICCRPNSGKTVFAYTVFGLLHNKGVRMPIVKDIFEVRDIFVSYYADAEEVELWSSSKLAIIKIPVDITTKVFDTMSTIVERRVRNNCSTIFLYGGTKKDILAQDKFSKLKYLEGDGSYNSIEIKSWL